MVFCIVVMIVAAILFAAQIKSFFDTVKRYRLLAGIHQKAEVYFGLKDRFLPITAEFAGLAVTLKRLNTAYEGLKGVKLSVDIPESFTEQQKARITEQSMGSLRQEILINRIALVTFAVLIIMQIIVLIANRYDYVTPLGIIIGDRYIKPENIRYSFTDEGAFLWLNGLEKPLLLVTKDRNTCDMLLRTYYTEKPTT